jgi:hypothetical protein
MKPIRKRSQLIRGAIMKGGRLGSFLSMTASGKRR